MLSHLAVAPLANSFSTYAFVSFPSQNTNLSAQDHENIIVVSSFSFLVFFLFVFVFYKENMNTHDNSVLNTIADKGSYVMCLKPQWINALEYI